MSRVVQFTESQLRAFARDAETVAAAATIYVPRTYSRARKAADRIMRKLGLTAYEDGEVSEEKPMRKRRRLE